MGALVAARNRHQPDVRQCKFLLEACHAVSPARRARSSSSCHVPPPPALPPPTPPCRPRCHGDAADSHLLARLARRRKGYCRETGECEQYSLSPCQGGRADPSTLRPHQMTLTVLPDRCCGCRQSCKWGRAPRAPPPFPPAPPSSPASPPPPPRPRQQRCHPNRRRPSRHRRAATHAATTPNGRVTERATMVARAPSTVPWAPTAPTVIARRPPPPPLPPQLPSSPSPLAPPPLSPSPSLPETTRPAEVERACAWWCNNLTRAAVVWQPRVSPPTRATAARLRIRAGANASTAQPRLHRQQGANLTAGTRPRSPVRELRGRGRRGARCSQRARHELHTRVPCRCARSRCACRAHVPAAA